MRSAISDAVVLMAGAGSRLRQSGRAVPKPLIPVLGRPLISYTLETLAQAGVKNVYAVVGYASDLVMTEMRPLIPAGLSVHFVPNDLWQKQNGISVLAVAGQVRSPFLLTMCDHLYDRAVVDTLMREAEPDRISIAVDRKIDSIFDLDDAMKVRTQDKRVIAIGKTLPQFDAIDTGMFVCAENIFGYLERAKAGGDCSLADGIRAAAAEDQVRVVDIGDAWWQDVDTPGMLGEAEAHLLSRLEGNRAGAGRSETRHTG